jgi:hypothetical protein
MLILKWKIEDVSTSSISHQIHDSKVVQFRRAVTQQMARIFTCAQLDSNE